MKVVLCEIKKNLQGTNCDGKETKTQINSVEQKEETNIQPEKNEETRIQKNADRVRNLQDIFKCSNIWIIGVTEGEEEHQEIENLFEKIMKKGELPQFGKENTLSGSPGSLESPKEVGPKEEHTKAHHNYISLD